MPRLMDIAIGAVVGAIATAAVAAFADVATMDPVKLSPQYYQVRLDNSRVRVLEYHLNPGEKETMHSHPEGIVFALADATIKNTFPDGSAKIHASVQGDVTWRDAVTHTGENVGGTQAHFLAVELKSCAK